MNQKIPLALSYDDVLLIPCYSEVNSRQDVDLTTTLSPKITLKIPLVSAKMDTITGVEMAIALGKLGGFGILPRFEIPEKQADKVKKVKKSGVLTAAAIGIKEGYIERAQMLVQAGADIINIDVAHGHMLQTMVATKTIKRMFGTDILLISGIVSTSEAAEDLYKAGADSLLVGVGVGATCTTRVQAGVGIPGFQALLDTAPVARKYKKTFLPDGGTRNSGDMVKALAAGASAVLGGFIFSGTDETPGKTVVIHGKKYKEYNGSASLKEKQKHVRQDSSDKNDTYTKHVEGVTSLVPYKGKVNDVVEDLLAGMRSGFSYCGAKNIKELWKKAKFIQITSAGLKESGAHDVIVNSHL